MKPTCRKNLDKLQRHALSGAPGHRDHSTALCPPKQQVLRAQVPGNTLGTAQSAPAHQPWPALWAGLQQPRKGRTPGSSSLPLLLLRPAHQAPGAEAMEDLPRGRRPRRTCFPRPGGLGPCPRNLTERGATPRRGGERRRWTPGQRAQGAGHRAAPPRPSQVAEDARQKRDRSPDGAPSTGPRENGPWEEKGRGRPAPAPGKAKPKPESSRAQRPRRAGPAHPPGYHKTRRTRSRSPEESSSSDHSQDTLEARPGPRKRQRTLSAPAQEPGGAPWSRLLTHMGALEVALEELQAPGGAFLPSPEPGPSQARQPSASQRAWLAWQLAQAGSSLHWALSTLQSLLAEQPSCTTGQPVLQGAPWGGQSLWWPSPS